MTREEALDILKYASDDEDLGNRLREAVQMAVPALEHNTPCSRCRYNEDDDIVCEVCPAMPPYKEEGAENGET